MGAETWEAKIADSVVGVLFLGARRGGRGPWLGFDELPRSVKDYLNLEIRPGAAGRVVLQGFENLEDIEAAIASEGRDRFGKRIGIQAVIWFDVEKERKRQKRTIPRGVRAIRNLKDLLQHFGADDVTDLNRRIYKDTSAGASISVLTPDGVWHHNGQDWSGIDEIVAFTVQTIIEGSDAEIQSEPFELPVTAAEVDAWLSDMEDQDEELWLEADQLRVAPKSLKQDWSPGRRRTPR